MGSEMCIRDRYDCDGNSICDGTWIENISYGSCSDYSLDECSSIVGLYSTVVIFKLFLVVEFIVLVMIY